MNRAFCDLDVSGFHPVMRGVQLEEGRYGLRAVVSDVKFDALADHLLASGVVELELNQGKGWRGDSIDFVAKLRDLRLFSITDFSIESVEPVHFLHKLKSLKIFTYCKSELRFAEFPVLEHCALDWRPKAKSLFDCISLRELFVNRYKGQDVVPFGKLINLESLAVLNGPVKNLYGLDRLTKLRSLRLAGLSTLSTLGGIESLPSLEELNINTCRAFESIDELASLSKLKILRLNNVGEIRSLSVLDKMKNLESVSFVESTNILDGDLSPLTRIKNLTHVAFRNRRHYSHRRENFGKAFFGASYVET